MTLQELRQTKGLTLQNLACTTGLTIVHLSRLEHGRCGLDALRVGSALAIASALGITVEELVRLEVVE